MKACVFPGQGAQALEMGEGLFTRYPEIMAAADAVLGYSVAELCLVDPQRRLHQTQYTQPALYVVNALTYMSRCDSGVPPPDFVAGHSLGEYNALLAAEVFDFETGLRLVKRRGELMSAASGGAMAAVLGCDQERVEEILHRNRLSNIDVANYNTPFQMVLSGPAEDIAQAEAIFSEAGATFTPLNVSAAFHSRYMEILVTPLRETLDLIEFHPPKIPVVSNVSARPYEANQVVENLLRQIREPVQWTESIRYLIGAGVEDFEEVGPGSVLTKLIKSIRKRSAPQPASTSRGSSASATALSITAERLGAESFKRDYNVRRAYVAGSMDQGISAKDLVVRMARAGYLGFFGAGGVQITEVEENIRSIKSSLSNGEPFGVSLPSIADDPAAEMALVEIFLKYGIRCIEASGYVSLSSALVRYRLNGLSRDADGRLVSAHKVIAKVSRPEVAEAFLNPPPEHVVVELVGAGLVSEEETQLARRMPMADDICVEGDSGGLMPTAILLPAMIRQRDEVCRLRQYDWEVRVGSSGGIGTPAAAASAFLLGADFILTGTINQCTVEAGTSDAVKDILQTMDVQDTELAPAGDLFELGSKVQVLRKSVLFPARANRLYDLWRHHCAWEEVDAQSRAKIERDYFGRSFERAYEEVKSHYSEKSPQEIERAERDKRHQMALVFRWYVAHSMQLALSGAKDQRSNYQVPCDSALGAFNRWVKGTQMESWRHRQVNVIADMLMEGAAQVLNEQLNRFSVQ